MQWEYRLLTHPSVQTREGGELGIDESRAGELDRLGSDGWEMVAAVPINNPDGFSAVTYVFKRPLESWRSESRGRR